MWKPTTFTPPPAINELAGSLSDSLDNLGTALKDGASGLGGLGLPSLPAPPDPTKDIRKSATGMLSSPVKCMAVTPYQQGVGSRKGDNAYLTPDEAIKTALSRVSDIAGDIGGDIAGEIKDVLETKSALVLLLIAAPEPADFAQALRAFNSVYPIKELQKAERRVSALATLELDKFKIPSAPAFPAWQSASPLSNPTGQAVAGALGAQLALAEGLQALNKAPGAVLSELSAKFEQKAQDAQQKLSALAQGMIGSNPGWFGLYLEGYALELAKLAADFAPPLPAVFKCCSVVVWAGPPEQVKYFKEIFNI